MAEVILFHHALGLTEGVEIFARKLRLEGHSVHTPDLFEGRKFESIEEGMGYVAEVGFEEILNRGVNAAERFPPDVCYAGFSLGVVPAQKLALTREKARGALLFYSCVPVSYFGPKWPDDLPAQIHAMKSDPVFTKDGDLDAAQDLTQSSKNVELFLYDGSDHYFADETLDTYDVDATKLLMRRVLEFLHGISDNTPEKT
jgi:dienelactone hydrolase